MIMFPEALNMVQSSPIAAMNIWTNKSLKCLCLNMTSQGSRRIRRIQKIRENQEIETKQSARVLKIWIIHSRTEFRRNEDMRGNHLSMKLNKLFTKWIVNYGVANVNKMERKRILPRRLKLIIQESLIFHNIQRCRK